MIVDKIIQLNNQDKARLTQFDINVDTLNAKEIWQYLASFWDFGTFRKGVSDLSGKRIITTLPENPHFPVYAYDEWKGGDWDAFSYGMDYDFYRSFFDQVRELQKNVPHPHQFGTLNTNCDWASDVWHSKNCYLSRTLLECEDLDYGFRLVKCKKSVDVTYSFELERCYDCLYCYKSYRLQHAVDCRNCLESYFLFDCRGCSNCFMSWNLRNKQYFIRNIQHTKEEYDAYIISLDLGSRSVRQELLKEFMDHIREDAFHRENYNVQVKNSTGNYLDHCNNCRECYFVEESENCVATARSLGSKDLLASFSSLKSESGYLLAMGSYSYGCMAILFSTNCRYSYYLDGCEECEYCFGCVGLRKKKYCILNKQYEKGEYEEIIEKIKNSMKANDTWGKFFPKDMSYTSYDESMAQFYYPLSADEISAQGFKLSDVIASVSEGINPNTLPDNIKDIDDIVCKTQLVCPVTTKKFGIASQELAFYKSEGIPLPLYYFDYRTLQRFTSFSSLSSFKGTCVECKKSIEHFYPDTWQYKKILCEECYKQNIA